MHARSERPSVASGVAERAAMAGGFSSVDGHAVTAAAFFSSLPYLTLPYLSAVKYKTQVAQVDLYLAYL